LQHVGDLSAREDPYDLSRLTDEELGDLERLLSKAADETPDAPPEKSLGSSAEWGSPATASLNRIWISFTPIVTRSIASVTSS
jgi:hypothetical protein